MNKDQLTTQIMQVFSEQLIYSPSERKQRVQDRVTGLINEFTNHQSAVELCPISNS